MDVYVSVFEISGLFLTVDNNDKGWENADFDGDCTISIASLALHPSPRPPPPTPAPVLELIPKELQDCSRWISCSVLTDPDSNLLPSFLQTCFSHTSPT